MPELHRSYSTWWLIVLPGALVSWLLQGPVWMTGGLLGIAAVVEIIAAFVRKKKGDTLSEHIWWILRGRPALIPLAVGFGVWLIWTAATLFPMGSDLDPIVGLYALVGGIIAWASIHFAFRGKYG